MMTVPKPEKEHDWLQRLVGEWTYEFEMPMKPGDPPMKFTGTESVRSIGGLWIQAEGKGHGPDGTPTTALLTLGYDPQKKKYVGTWLGSMMTYLWVYEGSLAGNTLKLDTVGPNFAVEGKMAKFQETLELKSDDLRHFSSAMQGDDGQWQQLMAMEYRRVK
jgi:hypothetical protein